jgi:hypothetical protein
MIELRKATEFMDTHARLLDRRRFDLLFGDGETDAAVAALESHANGDGGYGWALEPDLRSPTSQPGPALHAFEVFEEIAPSTSPAAARLCDWLDSVSLADGGLPFALAGASGPGSAPHWAGADPSRSSLHITSAVCGIAHRVAEHDPAVARHGWLARATQYCLRDVGRLERADSAIEFRFVIQFLDAVHGKSPDAAHQLERLGAFIPASGMMPVKGGAEGERMRPIDFSPEPDRPLRKLFRPAVIADDLDRLEAEQLDDGGWEVDFKAYSPAAALEWRGYATVHALKILRVNGRLAPEASGDPGRAPTRAR